MDKKDLKGRMDRAVETLHDAAQQEGTKIMGGARRVWMDPDSLVDIADTIEDAKTEID